MLKKQVVLTQTNMNGPWEVQLLGFTTEHYSLAQEKIGALIILERNDRAREFIIGGQALEGEPNRELLFSIFQKESPLHDGAVLIRKGRITQVACYLPLTPEEGLPKEWGTQTWVTS